MITQVFLLGSGIGQRHLQYMVSPRRACEKIDRLYDALNSLDRHIVHRVCRYKDLGQTFDKDGKPTNLQLKQFNYKDKSNYQWIFSYILYDNNNVEVKKMLGASMIRENKESKLLELVDRITESIICKLKNAI